MRGLTVWIVAAALVPAAPMSGLTPAAALCKEQCQKHCMGNDTPTERAECLKREKCESQPACPAGNAGIGSGTKFDPAIPPVTPTVRVPNVAPGGGAMQR